MRFRSIHLESRQFLSSEVMSR